MSDFPKTLVHPDHSPAILSMGRSGSATPGRPERFPPVFVHTQEQEDYERARGYLLPGEPRPQVDGYHEYPMMMEHPEYEPEVKSYVEGKTAADGTFTTWTVPGVPGKFHPKQANTPEEADEFRALGYVSGGFADVRAYERAQAKINPDYDPKEWPKMIDGVMMKDPDTPMNLETEYPKWVGDIVVNNPTEEAVARGSSKNEPVKRAEPKAAASDPDYAEFLAWKAAKAAEAGPTLADAIQARDEAVLNPMADSLLRDQLVADAEELGVTVDKRWSDKTLREKIEMALESSAAE